MDLNEIIIRCLKCGQKNRIPPDRLSKKMLCGKCHSRLDELIVQCFICGAKNRVSDEKLQARPICGRCRLPLYKCSRPVSH
ncbi:MAG: hypothetical protein ACE14T_02730 [Syntrophales bacterium]